MTQTVYRGSITVFLSLTIIMIISLVLSLVEVVHYTGTDYLCDAVADIGTESAFADYCRPLLEEYGILAIDGGYCDSQLNLGRLESRICEYVRDNIDPEGGANFMRAKGYDVEVLEYGVLTDSKGAALIKEAAIEAAYGIPDDLINSWKERGDKIIGENLDKSSIEEYLKESNKSLSDAQKNGLPEGSEGEIIESNLTDEEEKSLEELGNPIDIILEWKSKALLGQVIKNTGSISNEAISGNDRPSNRVSANWEHGKSLTVSGTERILFGEYLRQKLSTYRHDRNHKGLKYEWEYVISGKDSDMKNLEATVTKLLLLREAENLASIAKDGAKQATALSIAVAICGPLAIPAVIEPVKWGIIAAWAYLESVLDVRLLLSGGRVPIIKSNMEWTSNILALPTYVNPDVLAKNVNTGLSYEDYLMLITMTQSLGNLGLRTLDVMENSVRKWEYYSEIRMENFIYEGRFAYRYEVNPIFASLTPILAGKLGTYEFEKVKELSYL